MVKEDLKEKVNKDLIELFCKEAESDVIILNGEMTCQWYGFSNKYGDRESMHRCNGRGSHNVGEAKCQYANLLETLKKYRKQK